MFFGIGALVSLSAGLGFGLICNLENNAIKIEYVAPAKLNPAPYNPRKVTDDALASLAKLLDAHGFVDPVIARREDGLLIGGHQRLKANALRKKPDAKVPVVFLDNISDKKCKALNIALNNPSAMGEYDAPKLADLLQEIDTGAFDLEQFTAFSAEDMAQMMGIAVDLADVVPDPTDISETIHCPKCGHEFTQN